MPHIWQDERGKAWIDDSNVKVIESALDMVGYGWSAEQIHTEHGGYLSLAQIHAALAYYFDRKAEFDTEIERSENESRKALAAQENSPLIQKFRRERLERENGGSAS